MVRGAVKESQTFHRVCKLLAHGRCMDAHQRHSRHDTTPAQRAAQRRRQS